MADHQMDLLALRLFEQAKREHRAGELLECLFDGGSATVDASTGLLVLVSGDQLKMMWP